VSREKHSCRNYCAGRIMGIVDNLKLRGEIEESSRFEVKALSGWAWIPRDAVLMMCEHDRRFTVRKVE
jgi:hypothetical protein